MPTAKRGPCGLYFDWTPHVKPLPAPVNRDGRRPCGWTYFVHAPAVNRIKIGCTLVRPSKRLASLRQASPVNLCGLGLLHGSGLERYLHERFKKLRSHLEWFKASDHLMRFIKENAMPFDGGAVDWRMNREEEAKFYRQAVAELECWLLNNPK